MDEPELIFAEHPNYPDQVVCQASICPNFEKAHDEDQLVTDEEP